MRESVHTEISPMQLLIQGCKRNDRESQRLLYQHYYGYALSICIRYCQSYEEAREVVNDGFLKVFKKIDQYKMDTSFHGWVRRIMINTSIDLYRKEKMYYTVFSGSEPDETVSIESTVYNDLTYKDLIELVCRLSPAYRAVFNLHVIDGYTHKEIGKMLGIAEGTSKSNLLKARTKLRQALSKLSEKVYARSV